MVSRVVLPAHMDLIEIQSFIPQPSAGHAVMGAQPGVVLCPLRPPPRRVPRNPGASGAEVVAHLHVGLGGSWGHLPRCSWARSAPGRLPWEGTAT